MVMNFQSFIPEYFIKIYLIFFFFFLVNDCKVKKNTSELCSHFRLKFTPEIGNIVNWYFIAYFFQSVFRESRLVERNSICQGGK